MRLLEYEAVRSEQKARYEGQWHELVFDARQVRQVRPDVQVLEGLHFLASPRGAVDEGHWYDLDEVIIRPVATVCLRTPHDQ